MFDHYESIVYINGEMVKLEFWDTSALSNNTDLREYAIKKSDGFLVCFNVMD